MCNFSPILSLSCIHACIACSHMYIYSKNCACIFYIFANLHGGSQCPVHTTTTFIIIFFFSFPKCIHGMHACIHMHTWEGVSILYFVVIKSIQYNFLVKKLHHAYIHPCMHVCMQLFFLVCHFFAYNAQKCSLNSCAKYQWCCCCCCCCVLCACLPACLLLFLSIDIPLKGFQYTQIFVCNI